MEISQRIEQLKSEFSGFSSWEDKYGHIIRKGRNLGPMEESEQVEENKIKGCQSQVWLSAKLLEGKILFNAESDASIVKGIISILLEVYSDSTPEEILATKPVFLDEIGLRGHLSMSRANGLSSMLKQISLYAMAFQAKIKMGIA